MIHVLADIELAPGVRDEFIKIFKANVPAVQGEDGCVEYSPAIDTTTDIDVQVPGRENAVMVVEKWRDVDALKAHSVAPHMLTYKEATKDMVKSLTIRILDPA